MAFSQVDGEWWAATSRGVQEQWELASGEHVDVELMESGEEEHVRGVLACSETPADRARLWSLQRPDLTPWYVGADDPNLIVLKVVPDIN